MDNLPIELIEHISWFIDNKKDLLNFLLTSKDFYEFLSKNNYYNKFYPEIDRKYINENYIKLENNYSNSIFKLIIKNNKLILKFFNEIRIKNFDQVINKLILDIDSYFVKHNLINIYFDKDMNIIYIFYHKKMIKIINNDIINIIKKVFDKPINYFGRKYIIYDNKIYSHIDQTDEIMKHNDDRFIITKNEVYVKFKDDIKKVKDTDIGADLIHVSGFNFSSMLMISIKHIKNDNNTYNYFYDEFIKLFDKMDL